MTTIRTTIDVTPQFVYQLHTTIVKRFIEGLTARVHDDFASGDIHTFITDNIDAVRGAMSEILADDILVQIKDGSFPLEP